MTALLAGSHEVEPFSEVESAGMGLRRLRTLRAVILRKLPYEFIRSVSWNVPRSRLLARNSGITYCLDVPPGSLTKARMYVEPPLKERRAASPHLEERKQGRASLPEIQCLLATLAGRVALPAFALSASR
jgi:hypothetical protein